MTLQHTGGDGGGFHHCVHCGAVAAGPCARCRLPVCGDCVVLTEGGAHVWAVCTRCDARAGRSLSTGWLQVLGWIAVPILALAVAIWALGWVFGY
jgi:hypothetical protein